MVDLLSDTARDRGRVTRTVLLFLGVGPFVGALIVAVVLSILVVWDPGPYLRFEPSVVLGIVMVAVPSSYVLGGLPAAATGLVVAAVSRQGSPAWRLYLIAAAAGALLSPVLAFGILLGFFDQSPGYEEALLLGLSSVVGTLAAPLCTRLARRFHLLPEPKNTVASDGAQSRAK